MIEPGNHSLTVITLNRAKARDVAAENRTTSKQGALRINARARADGLPPSASSDRGGCWRPDQSGRYGARTTVLPMVSRRSIASSMVGTLLNSISRPTTGRICSRLFICRMLPPIPIPSARVKKFMPRLPVRRGSSTKKRQTTDQVEVAVDARLEAHRLFLQGDVGAHSAEPIHPGCPLGPRAATHPPRFARDAGLRATRPSLTPDAYECTDAQVDPQPDGNRVGPPTSRH